MGSTGRSKLESVGRLVVRVALALALASVASSWSPVKPPKQIAPVASSWSPITPDSSWSPGGRG